MSAETGVGPAIASGSQVVSGNWALLPTAPTSRNRQASSSALCDIFTVCEASIISGITSVPNILNKRNMPSMKPKSPMRFMMNALRAALALSRLEYQKPMSRYEAMPTPSQPTKMSG